MKKNIIITVTVLALLTLIGVKLMGNKAKIDEKNKQPEKSDLGIPVAVAEVSEGSTNTNIIRTGNLIPFKQAEIMATSAGKVVSVKYDLGTHVSQGAVLIQIDSKLKELSLDATNLSIEKFKKDNDRYGKLYAGNAATEVQLNDIKYNYENSVNQSEQIKQQIKDTRVLAPISGRVIAKSIEPGEYVNLGAKLGTILDVSRLKVRVFIGESDVYNLKEGQHVTLKTDIFPDKTFNGVISYVSPQGEDTHNYPVEITIQNAGNLKAGTFVTVTFPQKSNQTTLLIPRSALVESIRNPYVYVVNGTKVNQRTVQLGRELGDNIEVLGGLVKGDRVVTTGQINLSEGTPVRITK